MNSFRFLVVVVLAGLPLNAHAAGKRKQPAKVVPASHEVVVEKPSCSEPCAPACKPCGDSIGRRLLDWLTYRPARPSCCGVVCNPCCIPVYELFENRCREPVAPMPAEFAQVISIWPHKDLAGIHVADCRPGRCNGAAGCEGPTCRQRILDSLPRPNFSRSKKCNNCDDKPVIVHTTACPRCP